MILNFKRLLLVVFGLLPTPVPAIEMQVSLGLQDFSYKEFDDEGAVLDREDGLLPGVEGSLTHGLGAWSVGCQLHYYASDECHSS